MYYEQPTTYCKDAETLLEDTPVSLDYCQNLCESELGCIAVGYLLDIGMCVVLGKCLNMTLSHLLIESQYIKKGLLYLHTPIYKSKDVTISEKIKC